MSLWHFPVEPFQNGVVNTSINWRYFYLSLVCQTLWLEARSTSEADDFLLLTCKKLLRTYLVLVVVATDVNWGH